MRVFGDRLIDKDDVQILLNHSRDLIKRVFGGNFDSIFSYLDIDKNGKITEVDEINELIFTFLLSPIGVQGQYQEAVDKEVLKTSI